jgi:hypothetical protein
VINGLNSMANTASQNFIAGKMNKDYDERVLPSGQYIDAMNIRMGSTENNSIGAVENTKGNEKLTSLLYNGSPLTNNAKCIGVYEDGGRETIYWFVCDPGNVDLVVSFNTNNNILTYHVISTSVLHFDQTYLVNGINLIDDLLFWTDNYNPPRRININTNYPNPIAGVDQITEDDINVIVAPPLNSPTLTMVEKSGGENFMDDKFISFAYRYKYRDGEYSALSQFSDIAFIPGEFSINYDTFENRGMFNTYNSVIVSFNTGSSNVVGVDLCFKISDSNIVNVIDIYIKSEQGWIDNDTESINFTNQKIYTALTQSELLRLYDNVPRLAKSQTTMGNRIFYGNYVDGYDIDTTINYTLSKVSNPIGFKEITTTLSSSNYNIEGVPRTIQNSKIKFDLTGCDLTEGAKIGLAIYVSHNSFEGAASYDSDAPLNFFEGGVSFVLPRDYISVYDLVTSTEFQAAITIHQPIATCDLGLSLTDDFNCFINPKEDWSKVGTGIDAIDEGFRIIPGTGVDINCFYIQFLAAKYSEDSNPTNIAYEYFEDNGSSASYSRLESYASLHSNRDYEVAIVYMDKYLRSSTALVANNNTVFFPADASDTKNSIDVTIPAGNLAPSWAEFYKFVIKPSKTDYEVICSNIYYTDPITNTTWFLLEGNNVSKAKVGEFLIVKTDSGGPLTNLIRVKILDVRVMVANFIPGSNALAGTYMQLRASNFSAAASDSSFIGINTQITYVLGRGDQYGFTPLLETNPDYDPLIPGSLPLRPIAITAGSRVDIRFHNIRPSGGYEYTFQKSYTANRDYDSMYDFFVGENITLIDPSTNIAFYFDPNLRNVGGFTYDFTDVWENNFQFQYIPTSGAMALMWGSRLGATGSGSRNHMDGHINITVAPDNIIFETEGLDSNGETFYEGSESLRVVNRYHESSDGTYQTATTPALVNLNFFNCFAFGNGAESYKIGDNLLGMPFYLGSRVTAVSQEDYKEAHRYADITYSGVYNSETNVNKLNEFNLALANFKTIEKSFGPINKMYARRTDILTLQEDKISYVLAGKNLLSDASGGGAITSIPEVLGTQISRTEEFGISHNPESFAVYGNDVFFTDTKRSAVINLKGDGASSDQVSVISDLGLKSWFRDSFKNTFYNQKIGGYDPYMSEYVLSLNENELPTQLDSFSCGTSISVQNADSTYSFELLLTEAVGNVDIDYDFTEGDGTITINYDGANVVNEFVDGSGVLSFTKSNVFPKEAYVTIVSNNASYVITINCPSTNTLRVKRIVLNSPSDYEKTIHNNYRWSLGSYNSPYNVDSVIFDISGVSLFAERTGPMSSGTIPADESIVSMYYSKETDDTFDFVEGQNSFKYLSSDTDYDQEDLPTLLPLLNTATPIVGATYGSTFTYNKGDGPYYLYLVWDYRVKSSLELCYNETDPLSGCCGECDSTAMYYIDALTFEDATAVYTNSTLTILAPDGYYNHDGSFREQNDGHLLNIDTCAANAIIGNYDGIWELDDPEHPDGGTLVYIDECGITVTVTDIWLTGVCTEFTYSSIVNAETVGVTLNDCE